jgi:hypothetical protein
MFATVQKLKKKQILMRLPYINNLSVIISLNKGLK